MVIQIQIAVPSRAVGQAIAQALVQEGLAACVQQQGPMRSTYMWEGDLAQAEEYLLVVKSLAERYEAIETMVLDMHPYELPEILYTEVRGGLGGYLDWVAGG